MERKAGRSTPDLLFDSAAASPDAECLVFGDDTSTYAAIADRVSRASTGLLRLDLASRERVAVYLEKRPEGVIGMFAAMRAGGIVVPVNPSLRSRQVGHVLNDCGARILITSNTRLASLEDILGQCPALRRIIVVDEPAGMDSRGIDLVRWTDVAGDDASDSPRRIAPEDTAAILYTSGSTGKPKGVMLSHRNLTTGARSVAEYLGHTRRDRILAALPLSFDAGFSQLTSAFASGAAVVLLNYLLPTDVMRAVAKYRVSGLTAVPPLWIPLARLRWPSEAVRSLRYLASTGGRMPRSTVRALRDIFPDARIYLMYGFTEAFRSTYLDPAEVDRRPDSVGKAIPHADILVLRADGQPCAAHEPGELVHCGPLVAQGYWNDPKATAERFKPVDTAVGAPGGGPKAAAWSGDTVEMDEEGFLYFLGRNDEMIKTSAYRVSPTEIETVAYETGAVVEAVALGVPHPVLGEAIVLLVVPEDPEHFDETALIDTCKRELPSFMMPQHIEARGHLPRNPNGKFDRRTLRESLRDLFVSDDDEMLTD